MKIGLTSQLVNAKSGFLTIERVLPLSLFLVMLLSTLIKPAHAQACGQTVGTSSLHDWPSLDCAYPLHTLTGWIAHVDRSDESPSGLCPDPDGDWGIHLVPDASSAYLLMNSSQKRNSTLKDAVCGATWPGLVGDMFGSADVIGLEAEVLSSSPARGLDLASHFFPGMPVIAHGYWDEDTGHEDKTELHPLVFLDGDWGFGRSSVLVIQETSSRFVTSGSSQREDYTRIFRRQPVTRYLHELASPDTERTYGTVVFRETSRLDDTSDSLCAATFNTQANRTQMTTWLSHDGSAEFYVNLPPNDAWGCVYHVLLADYDRGEMTGLVEAIDTKLRDITWRDNSGVQHQGKSLETTVDLQLQPPPDDLSTLFGSPTSNPIVYSQWHYQQTSAVAGSAQWYDAEQTAGHHLQLKFVYDPDFDFTATSWAIEVAASTRAAGWSPALERPAANGMSGPFRRDFIHDARVYSVVPSRLDVSVDGTKAPAALSGLSRTCRSGYDVRTSTAYFIPRVGLRRITWSVQPGHTSNGSVFVGGPTEIGIDGGLPTTAGFNAATVEIDRTDPKHVTVSFKDLGWTALAADGGDFKAPWAAKNRSTLVLKALATTELGEALTLQTEELSLPDCYGQPVLQRGEADRWVLDAYKAYAAILKLEQLGLLPPHQSWMRDSLSPQQMTAIATAFPLYDVSKLVIGPTAVPRNAQGRQLQAALLRLSKELPLTSQQISIVSVAAHLGEPLPTPIGLIRTSRNLRPGGARGNALIPVPQAGLVSFVAIFDSSGRPDPRASIALARIAAAVRSDTSTRISVVGLPSYIKGVAARRRAAQGVSDALRLMGVPTSKVAISPSALGPGVLDRQGLAHVTLRID